MKKPVPMWLFLLAIWGLLVSQLFVNSQHKFNEAVLRFNDVAIQFQSYVIKSRGEP